MFQCKWLEKSWHFFSITRVSINYSSLGRFGCIKGVTPTEVFGAPGSLYMFTVGEEGFYSTSISVEYFATCQCELQAADVDGLRHVADVHAGHLSGRLLEKISGRRQHQLRQEELLRLRDGRQEACKQTFTSTVNGENVGRSAFLMIQVWHEMFLWVIKLKQNFSRQRISADLNLVTPTAETEIVISLPKNWPFWMTLNNWQLQLLIIHTYYTLNKSTLK